MELNGPQPQPAPEAEAVQVNLSGGVTGGPTGRPWCQLSFQLGLAQFTMVLPEKTLLDLADVLPAFLRERATEVRQARMGLVLGEGVQASMKDLKANGGRP